ncbi:MAG: diacylglycerol kinase [Verrucomicrobiota bacterium]|jgi:diacylglycerol kinase (ATP)
MKTCVILNPIAGSVKDVSLIRERLKKLQPTRFRITQQPGDAERFARESVEEGYELIVSAGGDGTLNEVVNGIAAAGCNSALAILPLGTGNDFARHLRLPTNMDEAIDRIGAAQTREIDLVRVTSDLVRYFVNVSSGGFSGLVDERLTPDMKRTWGPLAYLRSAAAAFPELRGYTTRVSLDDADAVDHDLYNVIVANGRYVAGGIPIAPEAEISDGLLDIILIPERGKAELALLAAQILVGRHLSSDAVIFHRAKRVAINSKPGMWFNVDGELIGNEPATFELLPGALRCVVGASEG